MSIKKRTFKDFVPPQDLFYVYVAGPISNGDLDENMYAATKTFNMLIAAGLIPIVPQGTAFLNWTYMPKSAENGQGAVSDHDYWLPYDFAFIRDVVHAVLRLPGLSPGSDFEQDFSQTISKPVFCDIESLFNYAEETGHRVDRLAAYEIGKIFEKEFE
jgi:hypothetical protein